MLAANRGEHGEFQAARGNAGLFMQPGNEGRRLDVWQRSELSALWPDEPHWTLRERPAGPFSTLFVARHA